MSNLLLVFKIYSCYSESEDRGLDQHELVSRRSLKEIQSLRPTQRLNLNYSCTDVTWSWSHPERLATSASNGAVVIWNAAAASSKSMEHVFHEHSRTAHKVHFSPVDPNLLASCSQDSTVRVYDVRMSSVVMTIGNENAGDPIRDVQFNPLEQVTRDALYT